MPQAPPQGMQIPERHQLGSLPAGDGQTWYVSGREGDEPMAWEQDEKGWQLALARDSSGYRWVRKRHYFIRPSACGEGMGQHVVHPATWPVKPRPDGRDDYMSVTCEKCGVNVPLQNWHHTDPTPSVKVVLPKSYKEPKSA